MRRKIRIRDGFSFLWANCFPWDCLFFSLFLHCILPDSCSRRLVLETVGLSDVMNVDGASLCSVLDYALHFALISVVT